MKMALNKTSGRPIDRQRSQRVSSLSRKAQEDVNRTNPNPKTAKFAVGEHGHSLSNPNVRTTKFSSSFAVPIRDHRRQSQLSGNQRSKSIGFLPDISQAAPKKQLTIKTRTLKAANSSRSVIELDGRGIEDRRISLQDNAEEHKMYEEFNEFQNEVKAESPFLERPSSVQESPNPINFVVPRNSLTNFMPVLPPPLTFGSGSSMEPSPSPPYNYPDFPAYPRSNYPPLPTHQPSTSVPSYVNVGQNYYYYDTPNHNHQHPMAHYPPLSNNSTLPNFDTEFTSPVGNDGVDYRNYNPSAFHPSHLYMPPLDHLFNMPNSDGRAGPMYPQPISPSQAYYMKDPSFSFPSHLAHSNKLMHYPSFQQQQQQLHLQQQQQQQQQYQYSQSQSSFPPISQVPRRSLGSTDSLRLLRLLAAHKSFDRMVAQLEDMLEGLLSSCRVRLLYFHSSHDTLYHPSPHSSNVKHFPKQIGLTGRAFKRQQFMHLVRPHSHDGFDRNIDHLLDCHLHDLSTLILIPCLADMWMNGEGPRETVGILQVFHYNPRQQSLTSSIPSSVFLPFLTEFADNIGNLLRTLSRGSQKEIIYNASIVSSKNMLALLEISRSLASETRIQPIVTHIVCHLPELLDCDRVTLYFTYKSTNELKVTKNASYGKKKTLYSWIFGQCNASELPFDPITEEFSLPMSEGIAGYVSRTGRIVNSASPSTDKHFYRKVDEETGYLTRNICCVPLVDSKNKEIIGVLQAINKNSMLNSFTENDCLLMKGFAYFATLSVKRSVLISQMNRALVHSDALLEMTKIIARELKLEPLIISICAKVRSIMNCEHCCIFMIDWERETFYTIEHLLEVQEYSQDSKGQLVPSPSANTIESKIISFAYKGTAGGIVGETFRSRKIVRRSSPQITLEETNLRLENNHVYNLICLPIFNNRNEILAVIQLVNKKEFESRVDTNDEDSTSGYLSRLPTMNRSPVLPTTSILSRISTLNSSPSARSTGKFAPAPFPVDTPRESSIGGFSINDTPYISPRHQGYTQTMPSHAETPTYGEFDDEDKELLLSFCMQVAIALENSNLYTSTEKALNFALAEQRNLKFHLKILQNIAKRSTFHPMAATILSHLRELYGMSEVLLYGCDQKTGKYWLIMEETPDDQKTYSPSFSPSTAAVANRNDESSREYIEIGKGCVGWVAQTHQKLSLPENASQDSRFKPTLDQYPNRCTKSILCIPLVDLESVSDRVPTGSSSIIGVLALRQSAYETENQLSLSQSTELLSVDAVSRMNLFNNSHQKSILPFCTQLSMIIQYTHQFQSLLQQKESANENYSMSNKENDNDDSAANYLKQQRGMQLSTDKIDQFAFKMEDIQLKGMIGSGSYGQVYRGILLNKSVAVKKFYKNSLNAEQIETFCREASVMCQLQHKNIVTFIGAITEAYNLAIITEFCSRGSLSDLLGDNSLPLNIHAKLHFSLDAAQGMMYLHTSNPMILHRDLKSDNLLVTTDWTIKVSDFGLTRFLNEKRKMTTVGTPIWMAPEIIRGERYTEKADIFSFGIILWEIYMRLTPYQNKEPMQILLEVVEKSLRPDIPPELRGSPLVSLMEECWDEDVSKRPHFDEILRRLLSIQAEIPENDNSPHGIPNLYKLGLGVPDLSLLPSCANIENGEVERMILAQQCAEEEQEREYLRREEIRRKEKLEEVNDWDESAQSSIRRESR